MSRTASSVQVALGEYTCERATVDSVEERRRQFGTDSKPAPGRVRDEREAIAEDRGAIRDIEWTRTMEGADRPAYSRRSTVEG